MLFFYYKKIIKGIQNKDREKYKLDNIAHQISECVLPLLLPLYNKDRPKPLNNKESAAWLSGFIDAEGNFQAFFDRYYLRVAFRIVLSVNRVHGHIDDLAVLQYICNYLKVGIVRINNKRCVFSITKLNEINKILIPLLDMHTLRTTKYLDYLDFKLIVDILNNSKSTRVIGDDLITAQKLIANMNSVK